MVTWRAYIKNVSRGDGTSPRKEVRRQRWIGSELLDAWRLASRVMLNGARPDVTATRRRTPNAPELRRTPRRAASSATRASSVGAGVA